VIVVGVWLIRTSPVDPDALGPIPTISERERLR